MAFDFPSSPSEGQAYSPSGGPRYVYKSGVWKADLPYSPFDFPRNRIVNPAFQVSQELGRTSTGVNFAYIADQWRFDFVASGAVPSAASDDGPPNFGRLWSGGTADATIAAGDFCRLQHQLEGIEIADLGWGAVGAAPVILAFKARFTGTPPFTFGVAVRNAAANRSYVKNFTITAAAGVWQDFSAVIPGDVTGTWLVDTSVSTQLSFAGVCGSTFQTATQNAWQAGNFLAGTGVSNLFAAAGQGLDIAEVGLYADFSGNGVAPRFETPDPIVELDRCQRYFETGQLRFNGPATSGVNQTVPQIFRTVKRVAPTITLSTAGQTSFPATPSAAGDVTPRGFSASRTANATGAGLFVDTWTSVAR